MRYDKTLLVLTGIIACSFMLIEISFFIHYRYFENARTKCSESMEELFNDSHRGSAYAELLGWYVNETKNSMRYERVFWNICNSRGYSRWGVNETSLICSGSHIKEENIVVQ